MAISRTTRRGGLYGALLVTGLVAAAPVGAQPSDTTAISTQPLFVKKDAYYAAGFIVATIAAAPLDKYFAVRLQRPWAQENRFLEKTADIFRWTGQPGAYIIGVTMYGVGRLAGNERNDAYRSFPSGHTVTGFAAAAAVVTETNRWWPNSTWYIGPLMYGGASLIGLSRMYNNKHWASDVITGALIGSFAGRKIVRYHHSHPGNRIDDLLLSGSISRGTNGGMALRMSILPGAMALSRR